MTFRNINSGGLIAIKLRDDDDIIYTGIVEDITKEHIFIATKLGYCTRFASDSIRTTGRNTMGVKAITLENDGNYFINVNQKTLVETY